MKPKHNAKYLKAHRKELRNNGTAAEAVLWNCLKKSQLQGRKFRRQHSINNYIVDFFCYAENLIIEVDGGIHDDPLHRWNDSRREQDLMKMGYKILRFTNKQVFDQLESVLLEIENSFTTPFR